jgi:hypothetical protein
MQGMPSLSDMLRSKYCRDDFKTCARFIARERLGPGKVPADLFPGDHAKLSGQPASPG